MSPLAWTALAVGVVLVAAAAFLIVCCAIAPDPRDVGPG